MSNRVTRPWAAIKVDPGCRTGPGIGWHVVAGGGPIRQSGRTSRTRRRGATIIEATIALAISIAVLAGVAQLVALTSNQWRVSQLRTTAVREAGNLMEDLMSRPWTDITAENLAAVEPSDWCRQTLPDARIRVELNSEGEDDEIKRIGIRIDWSNVSGDRAEPVRLVTWRFDDEESEP